MAGKLWNVDRWHQLLDRWEALLIQQESEPGRRIRRSPASAEEIEALEHRLGRPLPPSYRTFLQATNGANVRGWNWASGDIRSKDFDGLLPAADVQVVPRRHAHTILLWVTPENGIDDLFDPPPDVAQHLLDDIDAGQSECLIGHLLHAVALNGSLVHENIFIDPLEVDADGEWRAWTWNSDGPIRYHSFGDLIGAGVDALAAAEAGGRGNAQAGGEIDALVATIESGGAPAQAALARLVSLITANATPQVRGPAMWALLRCHAPEAQEAVLELVEAHPDDPVVAGNAIERGLAQKYTDRVRRAVKRYLLGPIGDWYAGYVMLSWPELVEDVWQETGNPLWLRHLIFADRPGSLKPAIAALMDPELAPETRNWLTYTMSGRARYHPDPPQIADVVRLAEVPGNDRLHLAQTLLGWGAIAEAMAVAGESLEHPSIVGGHIFPALAEAAPTEAASALIASLERAPTAAVLRTLAFIDHPAVVPAIANQVGSDLTADALLALEQVGSPEARGVLADHARRDVHAARALARCGDERAVQSLVPRLNGTERRSAVTGLAELHLPTVTPVLTEIAKGDEDDDIAVLAAYGVVMTDAQAARPVIEALVTRDDEHTQRLAEHWLDLLA